MKKIKNYIHNIFIVAFIILFPCIASQCVPSPKAYAGEKSEWKVFSKANCKVIDLDPMFENQFGLMIHFDNGSWATIWSSQIKTGWPSIGETGTLSRMKNKDGTWWRWKELVVKPKPKPKPKPKLKLAPKVEIVQVVNDWKKASLFPERNKVVVVKFNNNLTSTAYVNKYDEWKLDLNRNDYKGGRTLTNIKNWKEIGL